MGARPIDLHLKALKELGVRIVEDHGFIICDAEKLRGARIDLDFPSVGATENIMLTAVLAEGRTVISNAAKEPEIIDLQKFLNGMGAEIQGAGTAEIIIDGVKKLTRVEHHVMPDRIVAGTLLVAAAMTKGKITLTNIVPDHLYPVSAKLLEVGCEIKQHGDVMTLKGPEILGSIKTLMTNPHPGFPTDMQPQFMAMLSIAQGTSMIDETVFESRNKHIGELIRMGADILLTKDGMTSVIQGVPKLTGATVSSKDLRGGAALILAGLAAEGQTIVTNSSHVERGYESIEETIRSLGGAITFHP